MKVTSEQKLVTLQKKMTHLQFWILLFLSNLKIFLWFLLDFTTYVALDRSHLISIIPFFRFLSALLFLSLLDYCYSLYYYLKSTLYPLIIAFKSASRLVSHIPKFSVISPPFIHFLWLSFHFRSSFKIFFLKHKSSYSSSPSYLFKLPLTP